MCLSSHKNKQTLTICISFSSVASAYNHARKAAAPITPKIKTKLGRGYNPSLVNYKDSEYHYGSGETNLYYFFA